MPSKVQLNFQVPRKLAEKVRSDARRNNKTLDAVGETILSETTYHALDGSVKAEALPPSLVKGRHAPVQAYRIAALTPA